MASSSSPASKRRRTTKNQSNEEEEGNSSGSPSSTLERTSPVVVFAHGAGASSSSDWMIRWKEMLGKALHAVEVVTFDYPYMSGGKRRAPPKAEKLVDFHVDVVRETVSKYPGHPLILAGKSMGSRVSCMVACKEDISPAAIVCLGYPLKGSKDGLCPLEKLEATRKKMKSLTGLHVVDGGDHSFKIGKKQLRTNGLTQDEAEDLALHAIPAFLIQFLVGR